jgi:hypothetical protein
MPRGKFNNNLHEKNMRFIVTSGVAVMQWVDGVIGVRAACPRNYIWGVGRGERYFYSESYPARV